MTNFKVKISLSSVFIFLSFNKFYNLLTTLLLWCCAELRIANKAILTSLYSITGIVSVIILIVMANRFLKTENLKPRIVYQLIGLTAFLTISMMVVNKLYVEYTMKMESAVSDSTYFIHYAKFKFIDSIIPMFGLAYYLWKMSKKPVAANNNGQAT